MIFFSYCPFLNFVLCNFANVISESIIGRLLNFYQLVKYNEKIIWGKLLKYSYDFFLNNCCLNIVIFSLIFCNCYNNV